MKTLFTFLFMMLITGLAEAQNVGIGTTTPDGKLHVVTTESDGDVVGWGTGQLVIGGNGTQAGALGLSYSNTNNTGYISALSPNIAWRNLGFRSKNIHFYYNGTFEGMRLDSAGNVGIGTSTPHAALQFGDMISNRRIVLWEDADNDHNYYGLGINANSFRYQVATTNASHIFYAGSSATTSTELLRIQGNGNVGIGTSTPPAKFTIVGASTNPSIPNSTSTGIFRIAIGGAEGIDFGKMNSGSFAGWIQSGYASLADPLSLQPLGGKVGIGTTTPGSTLEVAGGVKISDSINIGGQVRIISGTPGAGKVLTSDATGLASWSTPAATGSHFIGESYGGGIVFYVYDNGQHGLIAATADQSTAIQWKNGVSRYTGTTGDGLNAGAMNTALIVATQMDDDQTGNFAAKICADYSVTVGGNTYGDWYHPSKYELNLLYLYKDEVGGFSNTFYWSSTEFTASGAWLQDFDNGTQVVLNKFVAGGAWVRAVRAF